MLASDMPAIPMWYSHRQFGWSDKVTGVEGHRVRHDRLRQPLAEVSHPRLAPPSRWADPGSVVGLPAQCRQADGLSGVSRGVTPAS